jgi:AcrR family transcriptional regulator
MGISERKEREKLQRRNDIIDAAEKVFFSKGIELATMDDIAHAAEYSKGTLYLYFRNKEELLYAIKMRASRLLKERFIKSINPKRNGYENVRAIGRAFIEYSIEYPDYHNFMMFWEGKDLDRLNLEDPFIKKFMEEENPMSSLWM